MSKLGGEGKLRTKHPRRKSFVQTVKNFFGRQFSTEKVTLEERDDLSDSVSSLEPAASKKQEEPWVQAYYNAAAMVFVFIAGCVILAVYYVLEPFLHPLLWAVLVGIVLHPFKHICTSEITQWLHYIQESGLPLSLGAIFTPLFLFNWLSAKLESVVVGNLWMISKLALGALVVLVLYMLSVPVYLYWGMQGLWHLFGHVAVLTQAPLYFSVSFKQL